MTAGAAAIVILGASGDLARRKLIPALQELFRAGKLDQNTVIAGAGRSAFTDEEFRARFRIDTAFASRLFYHQNIAGLRSFLGEKGSSGRIVFFCAQPPEAYAETVCALKKEGFGDEALFVLEKPFGNNYASARALNATLSSCFSEEQIFRIDHYLAKETVQNILVFRFANSLFYPVWNSRCIESIQISALEKDGVLDRAAYFDKAGIIRDMVQNHLFQLLSLLAMEAPSSLSAEDISRQKIELLRVIAVESCSRWQYRGYRNEKGISPSSETETFAEMRLSINNFRWTGMPVVLRTGKATNRKGTEIGVRLRNLPQLLFNEKGDLAPNRIVFKIQPAEGIILDLSSKAPGTDAAIAGTHMNFCYRDAFPSGIPEAYQRLLLDVIRGERTLSVTAEETETAWKILDRVLDKGDLRYYEPGTLPPSGPGVEWIDFEKYVPLCV